MKDALHTVEIPFHLRFMQIVRPPEDWEEWLELGRAATTLDQKLGLLHGAFEVEMGYREMNPETCRREPYTYADRLEEFFKIADGWADHYLFKTGRDRYGDETKYFIGLDKNWNRRWDNESPDTKATHDKEEKEALAMQVIVDNAKPWTIEVLAQLGELRLLEEWILDLDKASLATLKEIALRNEFREHLNPVSKERKVATIDEACYLGSASGWLLKKHEFAVREHKRLNAILSAEQKKREADREIAQLEKA